VPGAEAEPEKAANEMRSLQERWKTVAAAPRSQAESLWTRFKTAQDQVYEKCKDYFAQQAAERQENLKKKEALCARVEALTDSTDWVRTADAIKALQAEWKTIGAVTRGHEKSVWERFRTACDRFFTRRQEDLKERKHEWADNLAKKEALIAEADQLAQSTEWDRAANRIKQLQAEWKKIGPVRKNKSEVVWQRFRTACDTFFERYKTRDQVAVAGKLADRETAVAEIEALMPSAEAPDAAAPDDLYAKVQAARARYLQGPELPRHALAPLAERMNVALLALVNKWPDALRGTDMDPELTLRKMEKLVSKIEALLPPDSREPAANLSPAEMLARQWREALAANTMGAAAARQAEDARHRATEQEVRSAQSAWQRLGPLDAETRKPLQDRFDRACRRFFEQKRRHMAKT
jgi:predicted nuclease with TOPRIM domain